MSLESYCVVFIDVDLQGWTNCLEPVILTMETTPVSFSKATACYPPLVESVEILDYIKDVNGIGYSRDIGRSSALGGRIYYTFGDTFNKNKDGEFVGLSCNTVSMVLDIERPLTTAYLDIEENGMVKALVPLNESERLIEKDETEKVRIILWMFGGIAETRPDLGWTWYQVAEIHNNCEHTYQGVGIARVSVINEHGYLQVVRCKDLVYESDTNRKSQSDVPCRDLIFGRKEPRFGTFCSLVYNDMVYLWGDIEREIYLARVSKYKPTSRESYEFWDGKTYVSDWGRAIAILHDIPQGQFVRSDLFGSDRPWIFVGCTKWADSKVMMGASCRLEGPWELTPLCTAEGIDRRDEWMYCIYPHPWAFNEEEGELLVTWSEHWPGGVVGAKVKLRMGTPEIIA